MASCGPNVSQQSHAADLEHANQYVPLELNAYRNIRIPTNLRRLDPALAIAHAIDLRNLALRVHARRMWALKTLARVCKMTCAERISDGS
jgi:hypothetical protein